MEEHKLDSRIGDLFERNPEIHKQYKWQDGAEDNSSSSGSENDEIFNIDQMTFPCVILALGKPRRGKSYLIQYLVKYFSVVKPTFKFIKCFTGSYYNDDYKYLPEKAISKGYSSEELQKYHTKLIKLRETKGQDGMPDNVIIFDDLLGKLQADEYFNSVISTYRHTKTTIILANQYIASRASSTSLRSFANYAFLFKSLDKNSIKQYFDWFNGGAFDNYEEYKAFFLEATKEQHTSMLYIEDEDDPDRNFISFKAPDDARHKGVLFKDIKLNF